MEEKTPAEVTDYPEPNHKPVRVVEVQVPVKQSRDRAQYVREQKGHSLTLWLLFGGAVLWIPAIYYSFSPRHFWHA